MNNSLHKKFQVFRLVKFSLILREPFKIVMRTSLLIATFLPYMFITFLYVIIFMKLDFLIQFFPV